MTSKNGLMGNRMKKILTFILAAVTVLAASCERETVESGVIPESGKEGTTITFKATTESSKGNTRTELEGTSVLWSPEDQIMVFWKKDSEIKRALFSSDLDQPSETVDFSAFFDSVEDAPEAGKPVIAIHPPLWRDCDGESIELNVPVNQYPREDSFDPDAFPSVARSTTDNLKFYNVCGGIRLKFSRSDIARVEIYGDSDARLAGMVTVGFDDDGKPVIQDFVEPEDGADRVYVEPPYQQECFDPDHYYYVSVLPGNLGKRLYFILYSYDDPHITYAEKEYNESFTVKRSTFGSVCGFDKDLTYHTQFNGIHDPVDLGLSVMWSAVNLGADSPIHKGYYYAWGETEPREIPSKAAYLWGNSDYVSFELTKYCQNDNKTQLDADDDVAAVKLGGTWRIPSVADYIELLENCEATEIVNEYGVRGVLFKSKKAGYTDNEMFVPMAGGYFDDGENTVGTGFSYWLSSIDAKRMESQHNYDYAYAMQQFDKIGYSSYAGLSRWSLLPVRPVCDRTTPVINPDATISFNFQYLSCVSDAYVHLRSYQIISLDGAEMSEITWGSSDPAIVEIDAQTGRAKTKTPGRATITATLPNGASASTRMIVYTQSHVYVDLGLPSGNKWATCNVGANAPEEAGELFAWGELEPNDHYDDWTTYRWCEATVAGADTLVTITKYNELDGLVTLEPSDDAATMNWGPSWRMPTYQDFNELWRNCSYTTSTDKRYGIFTSKIEGYTDKSITIPIVDMPDYIDHGNTSLYYWSSTLSASSNRSMTILGLTCFRNVGMPVRPITN